MASLADAVAGEFRQSGTRCHVAIVRAQLVGTEIADEFEQMLSDGTAATALSRGLRKLGYQLSDFTITRHRRGDCACGR